MSRSHRLARFCDAFAPHILVSALLVLAFALWGAHGHLHLETDRYDMSASTSDTHAAYMAFKREFPLDGDLVVVVTGDDVEANRRAVEALGTRIRQEREHVAEVYDYVDTDFVGSRALLFLSVEQLEEIQEKLQQAVPAVRYILERPGLEPFFSRLDQEIDGFVQRAMRKRLDMDHKPRPMAIPKQVSAAAAALPLLVQTLDGMTASLTGAAYQSPWTRALAARQAGLASARLPRRMYLEVEHGRTIIILVKPVLERLTVSTSGPIIDRLHQIMAEARKAHPGVEMGLTGKPVIDHDEALIAAGDSSTATLISLAGVALLFLVTFGSLARPLLALSCLLMAMGWTLGLATITIGHLDALTVTAMPMLVGLGIDFAIQIMSRYEEERHAGLDSVSALSETLGGTGGAVFMAGLTTAVAFLATWFTGLQAMKELAIVAGGGILLCLVAMLVVLPAAMQMMGRFHMSARLLAVGRWQALPLTRVARFERQLLERSPGVVVLAGVLTMIMMGHARSVRFDTNLLDLQAAQVPAVQWEKRLAGSTGHASLPAAVIAEDVEQAQALEKQLVRLPAVARVLSVAPLFPTNQEEKLAIVQRMHQSLEDLPTLAVTLPKVRFASLGRSISNLRNIFLVLYPDVQAAGATALATEMRRFVWSADELTVRASRSGEAGASANIEQYQSRLFEDLRGKLDWLKKHRSVEPLTLENLPSALRTTVVSKKGRVLISVFPKGDIWDPLAFERFIEQVRSVDPHVTGLPVEIHESIRVLSEGYARANWYALAAVILVAFIHFRGIVSTLLSLVPVLLGLCWMLGIQGLVDVPFNLANQVVIPLLLGIGSANGIYIVRRCMEERDPSAFAVSTGKAILISNLMAMIGFASLMVARYNGIFTIGLTMTIGLCTTMLTSLVVLPCLMQLLQRTSLWIWSIRGHHTN